MSNDIDAVTGGYITAEALVIRGMGQDGVVIEFRVFPLFPW